MLRSSLTARLVLLLTLSIGLVLTVLATLEYFAARQEILDRVDRSTQRTVEDAVEKLEQQLETVEATTKLLAEILLQETETEAELVELLRQAVDERSDIFGGAIALDPRWTRQPLRGFAAYFFYNGGIEPQYKDLAGDYNYTGRAWYHETRDAGQPRWSEPYFDEGGGNVLMATFAVPMFHEVNGQREFYGVVTSDIALSALQSRVDRISLGESGFAFLLSLSGKLISAPEQGQLLSPLLQILPLGENLAYWSQMISSARRGETVSGRMPCYEGPGYCMLKLSPLQATGWPLGVYYSEREILQPLWDYLIKVSGSTILTLTLLSLIVTLVSRRITRPLGELARASRKLAGGDFSTPMPPTKRSDELGDLINAFASMQFDLQDHIQQLRRETATRNRLEGELDAASEIQMAMLPAGGQSSINEAAFQLWARLRPARSVGGDLYNYKQLDDGSLLLAVGDVSDKGVPAALFMSRAMTLLQQLDPGPGELPQALAGINNALTRRNENCMFVTLFLGRFDPQSLQLEYCSAGHTAPSLLRGGQAESLVPEAGPALGLSPDLEFPLNRVQLRANDLLGIYTDGIDEAFSETGEQFGIDRLNRELASAGAAPLPAAGESVLSAVDAHSGQRPQSDDIALLLMRVRAIEKDLEIGTNSCGEVLAWLGETARQLGFDEELTRELTLLSEEILTNIEKYAGLDAGQCVTLRLDKQDAGVELCVIDPGRAFNPLSEADRAELGVAADTAEIGGLGVHLLEAFSDRQAYRRVGEYNVLQLGKNRPTG